MADGKPNTLLEMRIAAIRAGLQGAIETIEEAERELQSLAEETAKEFADHAEALRQAERSMRAARDPNDKQLVWTPLKLVALRSQGGHVALRWIRTFPLGLKEKRTRYTNIDRERAGHFNIKTLHAIAPPFLRDIVVDAENTARPIRDAAAGLRKLKLQVRSQIEPGWRIAGRRKKSPPSE
jgi:hypothetical protein